MEARMTDPIAARVSVPEGTARLKSEIDKAWDDPRPSRRAAEVFDNIEAAHKRTLARLAGEGGERQ
jgi:hypothetical protein